MIAGHMLLNRPRRKNGKRKLSAAARFARARRVGRSLLKTHREAKRKYPSLFSAIGINRPGTWIPAFGSGGISLASNPGSVFGAVKSGFKPSVLMGTIPLAAGAVANKFLSAKVASFLPVQWRGGWRAAIVSAGTAGVLGAGVGMVNKKWAGRVFAGALMQSMVTLLEPVFSTIESKVSAMRTPAAPVSQPTSPVVAASAGVRGIDGGAHHPWVPAMARGISEVDNMDGERSGTFVPEYGAPIEM